jgi:hypothetical protein
VPAITKAEVERLKSKVGPGKSMRPYLKNKLKKKELECGSSDKVIEDLPSNHKSLSSIHGTTKKKKKKNH